MLARGKAGILHPKNTPAQGDLNCLALALGFAIALYVP
jgi:hypothetical protein